MSDDLKFLFMSLTKGLIQTNLSHSQNTRKTSEKMIDDIQVLE